MRLGVDSLSEDLQARPRPGHHLGFGLVRAGAEDLAKPAWVSDLQKL